MTAQELVITDKVIVKEAIIDASIDEVWNSWTTSEGVTAFLKSPSKIELKRGGAFEIYFAPDAEQGSRGSEDCKVISFLPKEMLSFSWNAPPIYPDIRYHEYKTWVVVQFYPLPDGKTRVKISHLGWPEGGNWDKTYAYFDSAWGYVLIALQNYYKEN